MPTPRSEQPLYPLSQVQALVKQGRYYVGTTRAVNPVIGVKRCTVTEARGYARAVVLALDGANFAGTETLADEREADVYGCWNEDQGWYVKVLIAAINPGKDDRLEVEIISCDPPTQDLQTLSELIPRGGQRPVVDDEDEEDDH